MKQILAWALGNQSIPSNEGAFDHFFELFSKGSIKVEFGKDATFEAVLQVLKENFEDKAWRERHYLGNAISAYGIIQFFWEPKPWSYSEVIDKVVSQFTELYRTNQIPPGIKFPGQWGSTNGSFNRINGPDKDTGKMSAIWENNTLKVIEGIKKLIHLYLSETKDINVEIDKLLINFVNGWLLLLARSYSKK